MVILSCPIYFSFNPINFFTLSEQLISVILNNRKILIQIEIKQIYFVAINYSENRVNREMSLQKKKMSDIVLQKMKEKKQAQQRNRPHYQLLQLNVKFALEEHQSLESQVQALTKMFDEEKCLLDELKANLHELQNTGKQTCPVIIIKPEFIASQRVTPQFKQFYRKASNTFMKLDMIKTQKYHSYRQNQQQISKKIDNISLLENYQREQALKNTKIRQQKRYNILKLDVKRRMLIEQQRKVDKQLQQLRLANKVLLGQYEIKKQNLKNRVNYSDELKVNIQEEKKKIQAKYNPTAYREYLKEVFNVRIKNQHLQNNLIQMINTLKQSQKVSRNYQKNLQNKFSINFVGKTADSPSKIKGKIQKSLFKQKAKRSQTNPKNLTEIINIKTAAIQTKVSNNVKSKNILKKQFERGIHSNSLRKTGSNTERNYSSAITLKNTLKGNIKTQRTLSTAFGLSSGKKRFQDLQK